jgi:hypothetical protein
MEMKALADRLLELERPKAAERKGGRPKKGEEKPGSRGTQVAKRAPHSTDIAAKAAGLGGKTTYNAIDKVQHHAECTPADLLARHSGQWRQAWVELSHA